MQYLRDRYTALKHFLPHEILRINYQIQRKNLSSYPARETISTPSEELPSCVKSNDNSLNRAVIINNLTFSCSLQWK